MKTIGRSDVIAVLESFDAMGQAAFLKKYSKGFGSRTTWIKHRKREYPIKAIWAASHSPTIAPTSFSTHDAKRALKALNFKIVERRHDREGRPYGSPDLEKLSFSKFCAALGFPLKNTRWSWSALNAFGDRALFTVWDNEIKEDGRSYVFWDGEADDLRTDRGAREMKRILDRALASDQLAYGIRCTPQYPLTVPRKRQSFDRTTLLAVQLRRKGKAVVGTIVGSISSQTQRSGYSIEGSALDDLDQLPMGNAAPGRVAYSGTFIIRDNLIRQAVIKRARGLCEYCGTPGFKKSDGSRYVEAHHIISLSKQGPDTLENVIALCPNHHRQAHFGDDGAQLEDKFLKILEKLQRRT